MSLYACSYWMFCEALWYKSANVYDNWSFYVLIVHSVSKELHKEAFIVCLSFFIQEYLSYYNQAIKGLVKKN